MTIYLSVEEYSIDPNALDKEWLQQTALYQRYARRLAEATYKKNRLEAYLDRDIRSSPKKYGFESKPTEPAIANVIKGHKDFLKIQYAFNRLTGDLKALEHKKKSLERLTDLYLSGYWARPRIKSEAQDLYAQQANEEILDSLRADRRMINLYEKRKR